ncbi:MAG: methyl-accepting chemotaxis protein [Chthoniobacter sp.]
MNGLENLKTGAKLLVGFGIMIVLLGTIIAIAYTCITAIRDSQRALFEKDFTIVEHLVELKADLNRQRADILQMIATADRTEQEAMEKDIKDRASEAEGTIKELFKFHQGDPNSLRQLEQLEAVRKDYNQTRELQIGLIYEGKAEEAKKLGLGTQSERYEKIRGLEIELGDNAREKARVAVASSEQAARDSIRLFVIVGIVALGMAVAMVTVLNRLISQPLVEITRVAERMAAGDLTMNLAANPRADEVGLLTQTFTRMAETLREQIRGLVEGASVLGSAASEIVASTTQLASSASESATAVSETTTTLEEVRQTAQIASQKAKAVSDCAQKVVHVSQAGRKSTEESAAGMIRIRQQMDSIADSMGRLSEQSQTIGQIIATVEDLAAQSNLLAVNAAIEAAKAGEHGKGFGVVAQEVKSLAEQSRQATNQVRTILTDIQKATTAAVMATEQGAKAVESGGKQTEAAGESIQSLSGSVAEAAQAATQIAASSQQQLVGMDQVAMAMENIKQASTQNVASAKQLETAARNLGELGQRLKEMVQRYKV